MPAQLILAFNSLPTEVSFSDRVAAAAAAGFSGVGVSVLEYQASGGSPASAAKLGSIAESYGVRISELEVALGFDSGHARSSCAAQLPVSWGPSSIAPGLTYHDGAIEHAAFELASETGAHHLVAVGSWGSRPHGKIVEEFAALCDRAMVH